MRKFKEKYFRKAKKGKRMIRSKEKLMRKLKVNDRDVVDDCLHVGPIFPSKRLDLDSKTAWGIFWAVKISKKDIFRPLGDSIVKKKLYCSHIVSDFGRNAVVGNVRFIE